MLAGRIVELDAAERLYHRARHAYTRKLLGSFPSLSGARGAFIRSGVDDTAGLTGGTHENTSGEGV